MKYDEKPMANPFVVLREEFDDWAILYNPDTGYGFGLSPTGVYVWKLLDGKHSIDEVFNALRRDALEVPEDAGEQIIAFVDVLNSHGLAGSKREKSSGYERGLASCCTRAGATNFTYEPPQLVNLSGESRAFGNCTDGSGVSGTCGTGYHPSCCESGTAAPYCCGGSSGFWSSNCFGAGSTATRCQTTGNSANCQ